MDRSSPASASDRESQAFWRGQRLTVYATALDAFEHLADRLIADAGLGDPPTPARADRISTDALAPIKRDLDTIGLIGSQDTVVLTNQVVADFEILATRMRHQGTLRRRTREGPQRRAHQTAGQDLGIPYAISFRSRNPPVSDTKPR